MSECGWCRKCNTLQDLEEVSFQNYVIYRCCGCTTPVDAERVLDCVGGFRLWKCGAMVAKHTNKSPLNTTLGTLFGSAVAALYG